MTTTVLFLLTAFGIKHFLADFWLQTSKMIVEKGIYGKRGGIDHAVVHGGFTMWVIALITNNIELSLIAGAIDCFLHYHIDWLKQKLNKNLTYTDRMWWFYMGADQALHYLTYIGIIYYVTTR